MGKGDSKCGYEVSVVSGESQGGSGLSYIHSCLQLRDQGLQLGLRGVFENIVGHDRKGREYGG